MGGTVLFVGTKKQARDSVKNWAERCGMPFVNQRWLGGLLTNFQTMSARIDRLHELNGSRTTAASTAADEGADVDGGRAREARIQPRRRSRHEAAAAGALIIDLKTEAIAVAEATRLGIPIPRARRLERRSDGGRLSDPGNDDSMRSCELVVGTIGAAVENAATTYREMEAKRRAEEGRRSARRRRRPSASARPRNGHARRPRRQPPRPRRRRRPSRRSRPPRRPRRRLRKHRSAGRPPAEGQGS